MHKSDRKVINALLLVAAIALGGILILDGQTPDFTTTSQQQTGTECQDAVAHHQAAPPPTEGVGHREGTLFSFDPNTADSTTLLQLGLKPFQVRNIYKYRNAGGFFQSKEAFAQLYGLTLGEYKRLEPYIHISDDYLPASQFVKSSRPSVTSGDRQSVSRDTLNYPIKLKEGQTIDLATADTTLLKRVPGIGSYYAREIVRYRERLGGYASLSQLDDIDQFPEKAKAFLRIDSLPSHQLPIHRLNVNKLSLTELRRHPYVNYYQARAITDYRRTHGPLKSLDELRLLPDFDERAIQRLAPYVEFEHR